MKIFTLAEIQSMPILGVGYTDNLVLDHPAGIRVWHSRLTTEDGAEADNIVTVEKFDRETGAWLTIDTYPAV